jgi:excisionase family DNA binding protein
MEKIKRRYVNVKSLSQYTSLSAKTLYEWTTSGRIPSIKIGRRVLFDLEDIDRFLASLKRDTEHCERIANKVIDNVCNNNYNASCGQTDAISFGKGGG